VTFRRPAEMPTCAALREMILRPLTRSDERLSAEHDTPDYRNADGQWSPPPGSRNDVTASAVNSSAIRYPVRGEAIDMTITSVRVGRGLLN